jgi:uncharacterized membrane protein
VLDDLENLIYKYTKPFLGCLMNHKVTAEQYICLLLYLYLYLTISFTMTRTEIKDDEPIIIRKSDKNDAEIVEEGVYIPTLVERKIIPVEETGMNIVEKTYKFTPRKDEALD